MKQLLILLYTIFIFSCTNRTVTQNEKTINRIEYIFNLKTQIAKNGWTEFADKKYDVPLIYYSDTCCYITNPTEKFIQQFNPNLIADKGALKIYKTKLVDSIPFHLETSITLGDSTDDYNYNSPFMKCMNYEATKKMIPKVKSTEQWATMILHEYFHGFQFKHPPYLRYFTKTIAIFPEDSLQQIALANKWFAESIDKENEKLLGALNAKNDSTIKLQIDSFFLLRSNRREKTRALLKLDITAFEKMYETSEGTARYCEYQLYKNFATLKPDYKLVKSDTSYQRYTYYSNYDINNDAWLFDTKRTKYYYAIGFNLVRLLTKLNIPYQSILFNQEGLTLEELLQSNYHKSRN
jgi:hypothetical protein